MPYVSVDVDIDLDEFDSVDLVEELESRGFIVENKASPNAVLFSYESPSVRDEAEVVYWQIRDGMAASKELRALITRITGKIL